MKKKQNSPPVAHLLQAQQVPALPYAKVVGRPGTGSYPAPSPDPTTYILHSQVHYIVLNFQGMCFSGKQVACSPIDSTSRLHV